MSLSDFFELLPYLVSALAVFWAYYTKQQAKERVKKIEDSYDIEKTKNAELVEKEFSGLSDIAVVRGMLSQVRTSRESEPRPTASE